MNDKSKVINLWGILDLTFMGWYIGSNVFHGEIPFYSDLLMAQNTASSFGHPLPFIGTIITLILYISLLFSGVLFLKHNKYGAIICYIQTPFRLLPLLRPSIWFIHLPLKYTFDIKEPSISLGIIFFSLILLSESLKLYTVIKWHKNIKKSYNKNMLLNAQPQDPF